jgi:signal transduction histidine kinase
MSIFTSFSSSSFNSILLLILLGFTPVFSEEFGYQNLTEEMMCYEDSNREFTLSDYAHNSKNLVHEKINQKEISILYSKSQYFCKIQFSSHSFLGSTLVVESSLLDYVDVIIKDQYSNYKTFKGGDRIISLSKGEKLFPRSMNLEEDLISSIYFRFDSFDGYFPNISVRLWDSNKLKSYEKTELALNMTVMGGLICFLIFTFFIFLNTLDKAYGFFSGYLASLFFIFMIENGIFYQFGLISSFLQNEGLLISSCFSVIFFVGVSFEFLNLSNFISKSREIYFGIVSLILILAVNFNEFSESFFLLFLITSIMMIAMIFLGIYQYVKSFHFESLLYLISFLPLILSSVIIGFRKLNILETSFFSDHAFVFGSSLHGILMSVSLLKKVNSAYTSSIEADKIKDLNQMTIHQIRELNEIHQKIERDSVVNLLAAHLAHEMNTPLGLISQGEDFMKKNVSELKELVFDSIDESEEGDQFKEEIELIFQDIEKGYNHISLGESKVKRGIQEIQGITGIDGMIIEEYDLAKLIFDTVQVCLDVNQISPETLNVKINQKVWSNSFLNQKIMIKSNPFIMTRAIRTVFSNAIHFALKGDKKNINIEIGMIPLGSRIMHTITILNDGPSLLPGQESELFDMKHYKLHGMEMIGLPMVKELLKNLGGNLILFDNGRKSGWVGFQIQISDYGHLTPNASKKG